MIRKLMVVLLSVAICLLVAAPLLAETNWGWSTPQEYEEATGNKIEKFNEAPILRLKVAAGELPPIEQRLPEEPLVDKPFEEVGTYGGAIRFGQASPWLWCPASLYTTMEYMLLLDRKAEKVIPNIAKGWEFSDDGKTFTLYLRKGMKWSDGAPFTVDDILFYWESVILNDEITPVKPMQFMPGGELMTLEKVDDYTVRFSFSKPFWAIIWYLAGTSFHGAQNYIFLPRHAFERYHLDYNPEADELAQEAGYDYWWQFFNSKRDFVLGRQLSYEGIPTLGPWLTEQILPEGVVYQRNPYYFKIDTAGNQLPYIDTVKGIVFGTEETKALKTVSGDYDYIEWFTNPKDYPVFMEGAEKGDYYVWLTPGLKGASPNYVINQNYNEDPVIGEIMRDVRFRRALSLAINREEFNDLFAYGKGVPRQCTVPPNNSYYEEKWARAYAEYDPERANEILDEMGLKWDKDHEWRLRPDGETINLVIFHLVEESPAGWSELIKEYWGEIGVQGFVKPVDRNYLMTSWAAGTQMVTPWAFNSAAEAAFAIGLSTESIYGRLWGVQWRAWWTTKGESGEEPPEDIKRMWFLYEEVAFLPVEERNQALKEVLDIYGDNLFEIGIIGMVPTPVITNVNLKNIDTDAYAVSPAIGIGTLNRLYQAFWK